jgi:hypothetical protein
MLSKSLLFKAIVFVFICLGPLTSGAQANSSFLGDPGTDVEAARAKLREQRAARLRWELATTVEAYDRIGTKNPRWDAAARDALTRYAEFLACTSDNKCGGELKGAFQKALSAGCTDPLIIYFGLRLDCYPRDISALDLAKLYTNAEERLQASGYPPIRKCYASVRAAEQAWKARDTTARTTNSETLALTNSVPALLARAEIQFEYLLRDESANRDSIYDLAEKAFLDVARDTPYGQTQVFEPLARLFVVNTSKIAGDAPGAGLIEGSFWVASAWSARGSGWSSSVTGNGWKLFGEYLQKAQTVLERAWAADPSDPNIAIQMMTVELGQGLGRDRLETWFRRAMDADPDSCEAAHKKMLYLEPRWHGTTEELLKFAHQCFDTGNWSSRIPFVLISAHIDLAYLSDRPNEYWKRPEVWNEVENFYSVYLAWNPNSSYDRSSYAMTALRADKWKIADEQFAALGDKADLKAMNCSAAQYKSFRQIAAAIAKRE